MSRATVIRCRDAAGNAVAAVTAIRCQSSVEGARPPPTEPDPSGLVDAESGPSDGRPSAGTASDASRNGPTRCGPCCIRPLNAPVCRARPSSTARPCVPRPGSTNGSGDDGAKRKRDPRVHLTADTQGRLPTLHVTSAMWTTAPRSDVSQKPRRPPSATPSFGPRRSKRPGAKPPEATRAHGAERRVVEPSRSRAQRHPERVEGCPSEGADWWSHPSPGQRASTASSKIASALPADVDIVTSSPSSASCSTGWTDGQVGASQPLVAVRGRLGWIDRRRGLPSPAGSGRRPPRSPRKPNAPMDHPRTRQTHPSGSPVDHSAACSSLRRWFWPIVREISERRAL